MPGHPYANAAPAAAGAPYTLNRAHPDAATAKRWATAQAHAAWFHGIQLEALEADDGGALYVATLGPLTRQFHTLADVERWLVALDAEGAPRGEVSRFMLERTA